MAYAAGVDVGSTQTKAVIIDEAGEIVGRSLVDTGANVVEAAKNAFEVAMGEQNLSEQEVGYVILVPPIECLPARIPILAEFGNTAAMDVIVTKPRGLDDDWLLVLLEAHALRVLVDGNAGPGANDIASF